MTIAEMLEANREEIAKGGSLRIAYDFTNENDTEGNVDND